MKLQAVLTVEDLRVALRQIAPLRLSFEEGTGGARFLELEPPRAIVLLAEEGVLLETRGHLHFTVGGVGLDAKLRRVLLVVRPQVISGEDQRLAIGLGLEEIEIQYTPPLVEAAIRHFVDAAFTPKKTQLSWRFPATLTHRFFLPARVEPPEQLSLVVESGSISIQADRLVFEVEFAPLEVVRGPGLQFGVADSGANNTLG